MYRFLLLPLALIATGSAAPDHRTFAIGSFDRLRVDGPFDVTVTSGSPAASADGDRQALDRLAVHVDGTTLYIGAMPGNSGEARALPATLHVAVPTLRGAVINGSGVIRIGVMRGDRVDVALNGAGSLAVDTVAADSLSVALFGAGGITLAGKVRQARVSAMGSGMVDGLGLLADEATLTSQTSGGMRMGVRYKAEVWATGTGGVEVIGKPQCRVHGSAPVQCADPVPARN